MSLTQGLHAQSGGDHQWRLLTNSDGMLSNDVRTIFIDEDSLWLGTDLGIAHYDGSWTNYYNNGAVVVAADMRSTALPPGAVVAFAQEPSTGALWAGTNTGALAYWDGNAWTFATSITPQLNAMAFDEEILVLGTDHGLIYLDDNNQQGTREENLESRAIHALLVHGARLWVGAEDGLWLREDGQWTHFILPAPLSSIDVYSVWQDDNGRLWLGTSQGVVWYRPEEGIWSDNLFPLFNERDMLMPVHTLTGDQDQGLWAGSIGGGARRFMMGTLISQDVSRTSGGGLSTPLVRDIAVDEQGNVWFATPIGLFQYQAQVWFNEYLESAGQDRRVNAINDLLFDSRGRLWVASGAGVRLKLPSLIDYTNVIFNRSGGHLPADGVNTLEEDAEGAIWAGTFNGIARYADGIWTRPIISSSLPSLVITDLHADEGGLWIGTEAGLAYVDHRANRVETISELAGRTVEVLATDGAGWLWVGTADDGIWIRDNEGWRQMAADPHTPGELPGPRIVTGGLTHVAGTKHEMWANVHDVGLMRWDGTKWHEAPNELPSRVLYRLFTDPGTGNLWVGSEGGISRHDGATWGTFTVKDGLQSTAIYAIAYDPAGAYWFGGPEGLTRYEPDDRAPWVRLEGVKGAETVDGVHQVRAGDTLSLNVVAGDLETLPVNLMIYARTHVTEGWTLLNAGRKDVVFDRPQTAEIEFMARDQAFNYSNVLRYELNVLQPPEVLTLPLLGEVESNIFALLVLLASMAVIGFGYVGIEMVQDRRRSYAAMDRGFNPYVSGEPIRTEDMFFGRKDLLARIVNTLHNNSIMIHGERRIGKTTLLYQLANALRQMNDPDFWFVSVYIDLEGTPQEGFFHFLIEEIATAVKELPDTDQALHATIDTLRFRQQEADAYDDRDFNNDLRIVIDLLQQYAAAHYPGQQLRLILLLDEMDAISRYDHLVQQQLRRIFMRDFSVTLGAVVAGIQISKEWDRVESPWFNLFNEIELEPFTREQGMDLLTKPVANTYRYEQSALEYIIDASEGRPFRIQQYALEAVNHMLSERRRKITLVDVEAAHQRIESNYGDVPADSSSDGEVGLSAKSATHTVEPSQ